ncbi:MAG: hypothetical protein J6M93_02530 [Succinivibrio sp.]|nr:hypothetical protein [Succinivibrio sp.]
MPTVEELQAEVERLKAEVERLRPHETKSVAVSLRITPHTAQDLDYAAHKAGQVKRATFLADLLEGENRDHLYHSYLHTKDPVYGLSVAYDGLFDALQYVPSDALPEVRKAQEIIEKLKKRFCPED